MKCFRNESPSPSPSPSLELIVTCVLQEQQQPDCPLVEVVMKNTLESCVSEIDTKSRLQSISKRQEEDHSCVSRPFQNPSNQLKKKARNSGLVNIRSLFPFIPLYRTGQCLKSLVEAVGISHGLEIETGAVPGSSDRLAFPQDDH